MNIKRAWIILFTVISALLIISGCDSRTGSEVNYSVTSINIIPREIYNDLNNQTNAIVSVTVEDNAGYPAANVAVDFSANIGHIQGKVFTDEYGIAETSFNDNGIVGWATIIASVEGSSVRDSVNIKESPSYELEIMNVSEPIIYVDNGITSSRIEVQVKNQQGFPVPGEDVFFQADFGYIQYSVSTDSSGIASTDFRDDGNINNVGLSTIHAYCGDSVADTTVTILAPPPVTSLEMSFGNQNSMPIGSVKTISVQANSNTIDGKAIDGTEVLFTTSLGFFQTSPNDNTSLGKSLIATTSNGIAEVYFNSSTLAGTSVITAEVIQVGNPLAPVEDQINITPGSANFIVLIPDTTSTYVGGDDVLIAAQVTDIYSNPINSGRVFFYTDLGNVTSPGQINNGIATTTFSPGINAGVAEITAMMDSAFASTVIEITSDEVNSIQFIDQSQVSIDVQGTGGIETAELAVNLYDMNGNLIDYPVEIFFQFISKPDNWQAWDSSNINSAVYVIGDSISVMSSNGMAVVAVNSGRKSGIIKVRASFENGNNDKSAQKSNIIVQAGPPDQCQFTIGGYDSGDDMGGGIWRVQTAAVITDEYSNPVGNGTAVFFKLENPDAVGEEGYSFATVETNTAYVGNENANGDSVAGTAFTHIVYDGKFTNEEIHIVVDVGGEQGIEEPIEFDGSLELPLQSGEITMLCVPTHVDWTEETITELILYTQCRINIRDGQNNPINKQRVMFTTSLGFPTDGDDDDNYIHPDEDDALNYDFLDPAMADLDWEGLNDDDDEFDGYTGPYDGGLGRLYKSVGFYRYECPEPIPSPPGMTNGTITATIFGTSRSANQTITLLKYVPTPE